MPLRVNSESPERGLLITHTEDDKFNVEAIIVRFITPLDEIRSQRYTTLVSLLAESCRKYPDKAQLSKRRAFLYGTALHSFSYRAGNSLVSGLTVNGIGDRYTIGGEKITEDCAQLLLDCIFDPDIKDGKFNEDYFAQKKRELIDKIKSSSDNRHSYAILRSRAVTFEDEPAAISSMGTLENAEALTNEQLVESYHTLLDEAFISVSFCGAGNNPEAQKMVTERLSKLARERSEKRTVIEDLLAPSVCADKTKYVTEEIEQAQSKLIMYFKTESDNILADKLTSAMFGGTPFSKLFANVREKLSLCYYCQSGYDECKKTMLVDSGVDAGNELKAQNEIVSQLDELRKGHFTDEELENTKRYMRGALIAYYDSAEDLNAWYFREFSRGMNNSPRDALKVIETITREDIIRSAKGFRLDTVYKLVPSGGEDDA